MHDAYQPGGLLTENKFTAADVYSNEYGDVHPTVMTQLKDSSDLGWDNRPKEEKPCRKWIEGSF